MESKLTNLREIRNNPENPRYIRDEKFEQLVKSLKDFPEMIQVRPLIVNQKMQALGGNMRLKAMIEAGWTECPVVQVDWSEEKQREFIIKDNLGFGEWDWDMLANEWNEEELQEWGMDTPDTWAEEELEAEEDDYSIPEEIKTDVVLGDLIEIGEHRLLCGDSTDSDQVAKLMNGEKADMVFTDPPYGMNFQSNFREKTPQFGKIENDDKILDISPLLFLYLKDNTAAYVCTRWDLYPEWYNQVSESFDVKNCIVWYKKGGGLGDLVNSYAPNHEFIIVGHKGKSKLKGKRHPDVWEFGRDSVNDYKHPTQKPVELSSFAIKNHSDNDNLILDLFLGSGSTMVAAHQLKRKCYGMELDPKYCQVIIDRMHKLDSNLPIKINGKEYTPDTPN